jgi:hypothetical protein
MDKSNGDGLLGTKLSDCVYRWFGHAIPTCGSLSSRETSPLYEWPTIWTRPCENVQLRRRYKGLGVPTDPVWQEQLFQGLATEGMRVYTCA